jgi:branched-chain amino acid aminotransferase
MDRSYLYGDALFETVRVEQGRPQRLVRHIARFQRSATELGFGDTTIDDGVAALAGLGALSRAEDCLVRVTVTRNSEHAPFGGEGGITVVARPLPEQHRPSLIVLRGWYWPADPLGGHKSTSYQRWVEARRRAQVMGADDAVMTSADGRVGETSTANVFIRVGDTVVTPPVEGLLPGVTRAAVIEHAGKIGCKIEVRAVAETELATADEIICTSAGVLAVSAASIDGRPLDEQFGPVFDQALRAGWP